MEFTEVRGVVNTLNQIAQELGLTDIQVSHNLNANNEVYKSMGEESPVDFGIEEPAIQFAQFIPGTQKVLKDHSVAFLIRDHSSALLMHRGDAFLRGVQFARKLGSNAKSLAV